MAYVSYSYRLRTSGPMTFDVGDMYAHTFMAEENEVTSYEATACFLTSQDMAGQFSDTGVPGEYASASYSALQYTAVGANGPIMMFQGEEVKKPVYISEEEIGQSAPRLVE